MCVRAQNHRRIMHTVTSLSELRVAVSLNSYSSPIEGLGRCACCVLTAAPATSIMIYLEPSPSNTIYLKSMQFRRTPGSSAIPESSGGRGARSTARQVHQERGRHPQLGAIARRPGSCGTGVPIRQVGGCFSLGKSCRSLNGAPSRLVCLGGQQSQFLYLVSSLIRPQSPRKVVIPSDDLIANFQMMKDRSLIIGTSLNNT